MFLFWFIRNNRMIVMFQFFIERHFFQENVSGVRPKHHILHFFYNNIYFQGPIKLGTLYMLQ